MSSDYHNKSIYNSDRPSSKAALYTLIAIVAIITVYSWMGKRDTEMITYECAPEIEMSMPIKVQS